MEATLIYVQSGLTYSRALEFNSLRGMDEPDRLLRVGITHECLNGNLEEQIRGFKKAILAEVRATTIALDRRFLAQFLINESHVLQYGYYISDVVFEEPELVSKWLYDCEHNRQFILSLIDTHVYTAWQDPTEEEDVPCFRNNVIINQDSTIDSPEVLTTNAVGGKLEFMEDGTAWPAFNDTLYDFLVLVHCSNGAVAVYPETHVEVGNNMQISFFAGSGFIPALDGKLYCNVAIYQRLKTV